MIGLEQRTADDIALEGHVGYGEEDLHQCSLHAIVVEHGFCPRT